MIIKDLKKTVNFLNGNKQKFLDEARRFLICVKEEIESIDPNLELSIKVSYVDRLSSGMVELVAEALDNQVLAAIKATHSAQLRMKRDDGVLIETKMSAYYDTVDSSEVAGKVISELKEKGGDNMATATKKTAPKSTAKKSPAKAMTPKRTSTPKKSK